jgi:transposase-like protein
MDEALKIRNAKEAVKIRAQETAKLKSTIHIPKCPTCGSPSIEKIPIAVKIFFLGPFAPLYKTYKCNHCGCKW